LPLLNLIRFLSAQLSSLSRSCWMAAQPAGASTTPPSLVSFLYPVCLPEPQGFDGLNSFSTGRSIFDVFLKQPCPCPAAAGLLLEAVSVLTPWLGLTEPPGPELLRLSCL